MQITAYAADDGACAGRARVSAAAFSPWGGTPRVRASFDEGFVQSLRPAHTGSGRTRTAFGAHLRTGAPFDAGFDRWTRISAAYTNSGTMRPGANESGLQIV